MERILYPQKSRIKNTGIFKIFECHPEIQKDTDFILILISLAKIVTLVSQAKNFKIEVFSDDLFIFFPIRT